MIRFHPEVAQLVREREPKERIEARPGDYLLVRRTVRNLDEVFYSILGYGKRAEILKPEELRQRMKEEISEWGKLYE